MMCLLECWSPDGTYTYMLCTLRFAVALVVTVKPKPRKGRQTRHPLPNFLSRASLSHPNWFENEALVMDV
ncbi:hypothetical protein BofuT4_P055010.1 [Botrytis cinerea T4]|uniref:Uncharacterized protein n=1 Tax=Botryotinia fuckeliana (strain T4) TaxID=999810 RepID=G2XVT0_BOTF4|nr:hypothetical protein BofuT4_P055010.1 [Botrytis cinerea T4]